VIDSTNDQVIVDDEARGSPSHCVPPERRAHVHLGFAGPTAPRRLTLSDSTHGSRTEQVRGVCRRAGAFISSALVRFATKWGRRGSGRSCRTDTFRTEGLAGRCLPAGARHWRATGPRRHRLRLSLRLPQLLSQEGSRRWDSTRGRFPTSRQAPTGRPGQLPARDLCPLGDDQRKYDHDLYRPLQTARLSERRYHPLRHIVPRVPPCVL
jgi:hypothetical protein